MMKKILSAGLFLGALLSLGMPVKMVITGINTIAKASNQTIQSIDPVVVKSANQRFVFSTRRNFRIDESAIHLQGVFHVRGKKYPASATKFGNTFVINHPSRIKNRRQRMNTITINTASYEAVGKVKSVPSSIFDTASCGSKHEEHEHSHAVMPLNEGMAKNTALFATLHTYADAEFYAKYGSSTNERILSYVNTAEAIYAHQLGIRFKIVGQSIQYTSDGELDPMTILSNFRKDATTQNSDVDLKHLFTGKDMKTPTIGIAYVGAVCYAPDYSYGVSQEYYGLTSLVFAHEVGHNFGAQHSTVYNSLMYPSISPYIEGFSPDSINLINTHLNYFGSCLSLDSYGPDLTKSTLTIKRMGKLLYGKLLDVSGNAISNQTILISVNGKIIERKTNSKGVYYFFLTAKKTKRKIVAYASTPNGEKSSRKLKFVI